ncbi:MAG: KpsF/GutQ family sugar-phosphate isomerase [Phycisphaerales bacterium]|nr:KpsF/GutQ family sugar-phosphate isomerase [Phycisphaerales bacterium]
MTPQTDQSSAQTQAETAQQERDFMSRAMTHEADAINRIATRIDEQFTKAVDLLERCADAGGTVVVSGLGKSGYIGSKISATLASLGIPSHPVHPTEAAHGDLGRFQSKDVVICLSHSGETEEVVNLAAILRQDNLPIIAITRGIVDGAPESALARLATVVLSVGVVGEAGDGEYLAPTSSTTAALAIGDALSLAVARRRSFTHEDFHARHPGGQLGSLLRPAMELVRFKAGSNLPIANESDTVSKALNDAAQVVRRPGALLVTNDSGKLTGIFTDSDLRRLILSNPDDLQKPISEIMSRDPRCLTIDAKATDAVAMFREYRADEIPIVDHQHKPMGLLDVQDLIAMKLVREST